MKYFFGCLLIATGLLHFLKTEFYLKIMPSYLPFPSELVMLSGFAAILLGILLMIRRTTRFAAWGIILFLFAVFPANVFMVFHPEIFPGIPLWLKWIRLPVQGLLILWAYRYTAAQRTIDGGFGV